MIQLLKAFCFSVWDRSFTSGSAFFRSGSDAPREEGRRAELNSLEAQLADRDRAIEALQGFLNEQSSFHRSRAKRFRHLDLLQSFRRTFAGTSLKSVGKQGIETW